MNPMNSYQAEQLEALRMVREQGLSLPSDLKEEVSRYLAFRRRTEAFYREHFEQTCSEKCYLSSLSACCSKDGIVIFFADVVINFLYSSENDLDLLEHAIKNPAAQGKCIFLARGGCLWRVKPIVCEMFVCDTAKKGAFEDSPEAAARWEKLENQRKTFTWPDRPVLFEHLERIFLDRGLESSLMHIHKSPGLMRIKKTRDNG